MPKILYCFEFIANKLLNKISQVFTTIFHLKKPQFLIDVAFIEGILAILVVSDLNLGNS